VALGHALEGKLTVKIVSSEAMARIDRRTQTEFAVPSTILMEDAGVKAWAAAQRLLWDGRQPRGRLVFVAGKGNNGGDAFVMARQASQGSGRSADGISIVLAVGDPPAKTDPATMLAMCRALGIECLDWSADREKARARIGEAAWIIDGVAGTGLRGALRPPLAEVVAEMNASPASKIAIDIPSGVGDDYAPGSPAVKALLTLTMGLPKSCLYLPGARALAGRIFVVPVGFPGTLTADPTIPGELLSRGAWRRLLPALPADTYKNKRGHLAVFAGSVGTTGAAWLCASAAARSRLGLVTLFIDTEAWQPLAQKLTSVMCRPWAPHGEPGKAAWDPGRYSGVLVGPGWGLTEEKQSWLSWLISQQVRGVIDADGLTLLGRGAAAGKLDLADRWVLTPHPGEFSRLAGLASDAVLGDPVGHALALSARLNAVIVLKGHCTVISSPGGRYWILDGANPAMATGGSGDVLAGIIAAGVAGGMTCLDAALFGVSLHAAVGRHATRRHGWFLAEDLVPLISRTLAR
jgi:ADP-dependent NAD(P)H-hydrate dehydratase / NAD(P)H-hydrate epimerase